MGKHIVVIGAGAAGMMAALAVSSATKVTLIEKNDRVGKKLFITGKGRCNVTNAGSPGDFFESIMTNGKFMYSSFYSFDNNSVMDFFEKAGCPLKVERGDRVFPVSDHSSDVIGVMKTMIHRRQNIELMLGTVVKDILVSDGHVIGVGTDKGDIRCESVIVATGGMSYPLTGSTGDGYRFAEGCGHTVKALSPSLVPFNIRESFCSDMMGLSLRNVGFHIRCGSKRVYDGQGELLFTHFGVSGPLVLSASAKLGKYTGKELDMYIDLKPAMDMDMLDARIQRDFAKYANKDFQNSLGELLPARLIEPVIHMSGIEPHKKVNSVTRQERQRLAETLKHFTLTFDGLRGYDEAIITRGGVNVKEVNPSTMESKLVKGLYFAGEVLDVDALTGGFNLQIAWSTGHQAGVSAGE